MPIPVGSGMNIEEVRSTIMKIEENGQNSAETSPVLNGTDSYTGMATSMKSQKSAPKKGF